MADVFMSYKSEDRELVATLAKALEREGISVWWDKKIAAGGTWRETIASALGQAKVVIVAWSKRTEDSASAAWVFNEVDEAQRMKLPLIPVQLEACNIPLGYRHVQAADLSAWRGDPNNHEWREVLDGVRAAIAGKAVGGATQARRVSNTPPPRSQPEQKSGSPLGGLLAIASLIALGVAGYMAWRTFGAPQASDVDIVAEAPSDVAAPGATPNAAPASVNRVAFGDASRALGEFRNEGGGMWGEYTAEGRRIFEFRERSISAESIALFDASRDASITLDLANRRVMFRIGQEPFQQLYAVRDVQSGAPLQRVQAPIPAGPARVVAFGGGGEHLGAFRREADGSWREYNLQGAHTFTFQARSETADRIELYDQSRNLWLAFDFAAAKVLLREGDGLWRDQYLIESVER